MDWCAAVHGVAKSRHTLATELQQHIRGMMPEGRHLCQTVSLKKKKARSELQNIYTHTDHNYVKKKRKKYTEKCPEGNTPSANSL